MLVTRSGSVCDAHLEEEDACNPRMHACNFCFEVPAVPVATTRMLATHVFPCLHRLRVAVGASGAEAALFISSRFKKNDSGQLAGPPAALGASGAETALLLISSFRRDN